ncbi:MAG: rhodanese-like domain-containing protein [Pseudomonadota bacterium]
MHISHAHRVFVVAASFLGAWGSHAAWAADAKAVVVDEMSAYLEFVDYGGGTIFSEQIPKDEYAKMMVIDTRDASQFGKDHIPGAVHIEWRQVLAQSAQIPKNKTVLLYCNTGSLSAQAGFALRVAGWENVRILQGGYAEWKAKGGMDANLKAVSAPKH